MKLYNDEQLRGTLTVREVQDILNKYGVPFNEFVLKSMVRQAKHHPVERFVYRCWVLLKAFAKFLWKKLEAYLFGDGKYDKSKTNKEVTDDGRKDV